MKKRFLLLALLPLTSLCFADHDRAWLELGAGLYGSSIKFKIRDQNRGWTASYSGFDNQDSHLFDSFRDRRSMELVDPEWTTFGVSRFIATSFNWGYADVGVGVAFGKGQWVENCGSEAKGLLGERYICDYHEDSVFGIPLQGSAVLGKYAGIGLYYDAFFSLEQDPQVQLGIVIPLGNFTR